MHVITHVSFRWNIAVSQNNIYFILSVYQRFELIFFFKFRFSILIVYNVLLQLIFNEEYVNCLHKCKLKFEIDEV